MPTRQPIRSWVHVRELTERYRYRHKSGVMTISYNPPADAKEKEHVPFFIKYLTPSGHVESGQCITLKVYPGVGRMIQFVESKQIRRIYDFLIMEIDGVRIITN